MAIFREKFEAFLDLITSFVLRLWPKSAQQQPSSPPSPNVDLETSGQSQPLPRVPSLSSPSFNAESQLLNLLAAAQQHQQWLGAILTFCFSFALGISLQFSKTNQSKELPASFVLLSFVVLLIFCILLVAFFIRQSHAGTSQVLEKVAVFLTAAAFCHATAIPFPLNLKLITWTLFLISSFVVAIVPRHFNSCVNNNSS